MTIVIYILLILGVFLTGLNLLPDYSTAPLPTEILSSINYFIAILKNWNWLFAIDTLFQIVILMFTYEIIIWSWFKILSPVIKFLRGQQ